MEIGTATLQTTNVISMIVAREGVRTTAVIIRRIGKAKLMTPFCYSPFLVAK